MPRLLGWDYTELPPDARKTFEVALHAGSAPALAVALRGELLRDPHLQALTVLPPALVGLAFERQIEGRFGDVRSVALAQIMGGLALLLADLRPELRSSPTAADHLAVGFAQAAALIPGVSRSGSTISAGLFLGMKRETAARFSFLMSLPAIVLAALFEMRGVVSGSDALETKAGESISAGEVVVSCLFAFVVGYFAIAFLLRFLTRHGLEVFVVYRIVLGVAVLALTASGAIH